MTDAMSDGTSDGAKGLYYPEGYERSGGHNNLNPRLDILPVSTDGYSISDMNMYYVGGYLLKWMSDRKRFTPVRVVEVLDKEGEYHFRYKGVSGNLYSRPCDQFFRFVPESGYYLKPSSGVLFKVLLYSFGYKKCMMSNNITVNRYLGNRFARVSLSDEELLEFLIFVLYPEDKGVNVRVIRRFTFASGENLRMFPSDAVIGKYNREKNELITPIESIASRVQELQEDVKCLKI